MFQWLVKPLPTRKWPTWARYVSTAAIVLCAFGVQSWIWPYITGFPFLLFFIAIISSAVLFDHGTSIFATVSSAALADYFFLHPIDSFLIEHDVVPWLLFVGIGMTIGVVVEALHVAAHRLREANVELARTAEEKDLLLRENAHRTLNDLQMLGALITLQQRSTREPAAVAALEATSTRIHLLGRVHQRLRRSRNTAVVDMGEFITELCRDLKNTLIGHRPIRLEAKAENHWLPQDRATAVGLIINELLTNALKHAFPGERPGTVTIEFVRTDAGQFRLVVNDDGVGMSVDPEPKAAGGLGQLLVRSLAEQLRGTYEIKSSQGAIGTSAAVVFPADA